MGPRNDCYDPAAALQREEARAFHAWQARELAAADFVLAATLPSVSEALGIADVVTVPCFVSFVITSRGELLDGTPLEDVIARIDATALKRPAGYWINCVHPRTVLSGLAAVRNPETIQRICGVQGNTSPLDPRSFSQAADYAADSPADFGAAMAEIRRRFGIAVLGGCCGTRRVHLEEIARRIAPTGSNGAAPAAG
jgi:homocysteine S-methyltransferase